MNEKILKTIQKVCKRLAPKFTFGYFSVEDIEQEAFIFALDALPRFDKTKSSLESFLFTHISNKLKTFKRDNYFRKDFECKYCGRKDPNCEHCKRREWKHSIKKHLMEPLDIDNISDNTEKNMSLSSDILSSLEMKEMFEIINNKLDICLREDLIKMMHGIPISKTKKQIIEANIIIILGENGYLNDDN